MAAGDIFNATITGGGPFGFRLFGGQHAPLVVAKLRKNSKASNAGIQEGDVVLGINGYTCKGMSHGTAVGLVDNSTVTLNFTLFRGTQDRNAVDAAFQELGGQLQPLPASAAPQASPSAPQSMAALSMHAPTPQINGIPTKSQVHRQSKTFTEGGMTTNVQTETETRTFGGGNTVTTVKRQTVSSSSVGQPYVQSQGPKPFQPLGVTPFQPSRSPQRSPNQPAAQSNAPVFKVSKFQAGPTADKKWNPLGGPAGVSVQQNPDQSITMTLDIDASEKENTAPKRDVPVFKVAKVADKPTGGVWQPTNAPLKPAPKAPPSPQPAAPKPKKVWEPKPQQYELEPDFQDPEGKDVQWPLGSAAPPPNPDLTRMLQESYASVSEESYGSPASHRKKKVYADSSFYNDPEGKYPTIEEQIKMARKVAISLMAPQNVSARGHKMFVKRRKKADKWIAGQQPPGLFGEETDDEEKFYVEAPWDKGSHTWQPPSFAPGVIPPAPKWEPPSHVFGLSTVPSDEVDSEKKKVMSADEIERQRLFSEKVSHDKVNPQLCFTLADALRSSRGKGASLFQRKREQSEQYAHTDTYIPDRPDTEGDPRVKARILMGAQQEQFQSRPAAVPDQQPFVPQLEPEPAPGMPRLQAMIEMPKPAVSPWEAASQNARGDCELAFEHLKMFDAQRALLESRTRGTNPYPTQKTLEAKIQATTIVNDNKANSLAFKPTETKMPDYTRKIKPWGSGGGGEAVSIATPAQGGLGYAPVQTTTTAKVKSVIRPVSFAPVVPPISGLPVATDPGFSDL